MTDQPNPQILSESALDEIEKRANGATEPPWDAQSIEMSLEADKWMRGDNNTADALFMAHARTDIPALCQTVRAAWRDRDRALTPSIVESLRLLDSAGYGAEVPNSMSEMIKKVLAENAALREQLAEARQERREALQAGLDHLSEIQGLQSRLAQVEKERDDLQAHLEERDLLLSEGL